ncbi:MAG: PAS domain-containing sensor histidine kinase [Pseudomonadota bacterium]
MRLSANLIGLVQPFQTVLRPSLGEQAQGYAAHRRFLDGQLLVAIACLTALPIILLTLGAQGTAAALVATALCLALVGIVSITHLQSLALPVLLWGLAAATAVMMFAVTHSALIVGAAICSCILGFEGRLRGGLGGVLCGLALSASASVVAVFFALPVSQSEVMLTAAPWVLVALGAAFSVWSASRMTSRFSTADENLQRERDRFHLMADNATDLITRHNGQGRTLFASAASLEMLGLAPKNLLDTGLLEKIHLQDRVEFLRAVSCAVNDGRASRIKLRMRARVSGASDWVHVEMRCRPFATHDGKQDGAVVSSRDVTAEVKAAQQTRAAQAEVLEANAAQRRFLMTMSHELRTPLNAIIGFSDMLAMEGSAAPKPDKQKEYVEIIQQSGSHLLQVVNGLLDLSRIEAGKYELNPEPFDLAEIAQASVRMLGVQARDAQVAIKLSLPSDLPTLTADRGAIQQVLINLLSNAIKFSRPEGRVTIDVKRLGRALQIRVRDEGIGIAADCIERLGEPFWQAETGSARAHQGSGLGLSVVRGLVELHGGQIDFESKLGLGTTVTVRLPLTANKAKPVPDDAERSLVHLSRQPKAAKAQSAGAQRPDTETPKTGTQVQSPNQSSVTMEGRRHARVSA